MKSTSWTLPPDLGAEKEVMEKNTWVEPRKRETTRKEKEIVVPGFYVSSAAPFALTGLLVAWLRGYKVFMIPLPREKLTRINSM